jgi:hypothetical protein
MDIPPFFIGRKPNAESKSHIADAQTKLEVAESFKRISDPRLALIGGIGIVKATRGLSVEDLNTLIQPLPDSGEFNMELAVRGLQLIHGRKLLPYLAIKLDDSESVYRNEVKLFQNRAESYLPIKKYDGVLSAQVSLGRVSIDNLTMELVEQIESDLPQTLTFDPIIFTNYDIENVGPINKKLVEPSNQRKSIPIDFLNSLRKQ